VQSDGHVFCFVETRQMTGSFDFSGRVDAAVGAGYEWGFGLPEHGVPVSAMSPGGATLADDGFAV
jgi:hypothetical protein